MSITSEQIKYLSLLAHLAISADEAKQLRQQINSIVDFVSQLQTVDVAAVEPTYYLPRQGSRLRPDHPHLSERKDILAVMPEKEGDLLKTPQVFNG